jgi:hypothetical protein
MNIMDVNGRASNRAAVLIMFILFILAGIPRLLDVQVALGGEELRHSNFGQATGVADGARISEDERGEIAALVAQLEAKRVAYGGAGHVMGADDALLLDRAEAARRDVWDHRDGIAVHRDAFLAAR